MPRRNFLVSGDEYIVDGTRMIYLRLRDGQMRFLKFNGEFVNLTPEEITTLEHPEFAEGHS